MGFVLGNSQHTLTFFKRWITWRNLVIQYPMEISYHTYTSWMVDLPISHPTKELKIFIFGYPGPRPCRRYLPHLGAVDPPHLEGVQSGPRCRSRPLPWRFFTQAANIFTRMRWMFRKPATKHTVVYVKKLQQQYLDANKIQIHISLCFVQDWHGSC